MDWISYIHSNENQAFKEIYGLYEKPCVAWIKKSFNVDKAIAKDIFQNSLVIFYDNITKGKFVNLTSDIKPYIYSIARNKVWEVFRNSKKRKQGEMGYWNQFDDDDDKIDLESNLELLDVVLDEIGDPCKTLLELFYYQNLNLDEIMIKMNYSSRNTVKTKKYKCIKRLQMAYLRHIK